MANICFEVDDDVNQAIKAKLKGSGLKKKHVINQALRDELITKKKPKQESAKEVIPVIPDIDEIREYFNLVTGRKFRNIDAVLPRLKEGHTIEDIKLVIDYKSNQWMGTKDQQYLRPETLFRSSKFEGYLNDARQGVKHEEDRQDSSKPRLSAIDSARANIEAAKRQRNSSLGQDAGPVREQVDNQLLIRS